jgi:hypothetical protein
MKHLHPDWAVIEMKNEKSRKRKQNQIPESWNKKQNPCPAAACGFSTHADPDQNRRDQQEAVTGNQVQRKTKHQTLRSIR